MAFARCSRCGKAIAAGLACVCAFAATYPSDDLCPDYRAAIAMFCNLPVGSEPVHGPHQDEPGRAPPDRQVMVSSASSSSAYSSSRWTPWVVKG
jgi:hypothetical protein